MSNVSRITHSLKSFDDKCLGNVLFISHIGIKRFVNLSVPSFTKNRKSFIIQSTFFSIRDNSFSLRILLVIGLKIYFACIFVQKPFIG